MSEAPEDYWTITPRALFELVDHKRRYQGKPPIDHGTMSARLILKCNLACGGRVDFAAPELKLDDETLRALEEVLNEQFGLYMRNELVRHCKRPQRPVSRATPSADPSAAAAAGVPERPGLMGRLRRLLRTS